MDKQYYILGIGHPIAEAEEKSPPLVLQSEFTEAGLVVMSADAPVDADGRPDGTIYIQTA